MTNRYPSTSTNSLSAGAPTRRSNPTSSSVVRGYRPTADASRPATVTRKACPSSRPISSIRHRPHSHAATPTATPARAVTVP